jgi:hypothetical protein
MAIAVMTIEGEKDMTEVKKLLLLGASLSLAVGCVAEPELADEAQGAADALVVEAAEGNRAELLHKLPSFTPKLGELAPTEGTLGPAPASPTSRSMPSARATSDGNSPAPPRPRLPTITAAPCCA